MYYVRIHQLGGVFVWALKDDDEYGNLTKTMADGLP